MEDTVLDPVFKLTAVTLLTLVFGGAAAGKFRAMDELTGVIWNYRLLPDAVVRPVAYVLPVTETIVALGLVLEGSRAYAAAVAAGLLAVFSAAIAINLLRGRRAIDCGCFGRHLRQSLTWWLVIRNGVLMLLAAIICVAGGVNRPLAWHETASGIIAGLGLYLVYHTASALLSLSAAGAPLQLDGHRHE